MSARLSFAYVWKKIGVDLGTTTVLVYMPKRGIIINEPSIVAILIDKKC